MHELALFAGAGGGILGGLLLGWRTVCAVEIDPYARSVLLARQNDGTLTPFPVWDDIRTFDGRPWRGIVDVVSGGFPCTDISAAGKGAGIEGENSGLWVEMARIIGEVRPRFALVENSPVLTSRGLHRVLGDLAALGMDARYGVVSAADTGAPHLRERIWIVAHAQSFTEREPANKANAEPVSGAPRNEFSNGCKYVSDAYGQPQRRSTEPRSQCGEWPVEPAVGRVAHGVAFRVDRLKTIGNGQVPRVVNLAWGLLATVKAF